MKSLAFEAVDFTADPETRTLRGMLLPFGQVSRPARDRLTGKVGRYRFAAGTVALPENPADVVLNYGHDESLTAQVGVGKEFTLTPEGVLAVFKIARTPEGDRILALADPETPVLKSFSAEVNGAFGTPDGDGVQDAIKTAIDGAAVVRVPAFEGAGITHVAASAVTNQEEHMECTKCGVVHAAGVVECQTAMPFSAAQGDTLTKQVGDLAKQVTDLAQMKMPVEQLAAQFAKFEVTEKPIYRFDGNLADSGHDFSTDFIAAIRDGDGVASKRVMDFANASIMNPAGMPAFLIDQADTAPVNPAKYRPDLFKDEEPPLPSPMYDTFYAGAVADNTPFFYSKLGAYALDTAVHIEGVEPGEGSFATVAGATITPKLESGRFGLTREVIDQGGNPQVSGMIWNKVLRTHRLKLESLTAAAVKSGLAGYTALATVAAGADGATIGKAIKSGLVDLRYTADGQRYTKFFAAKALYKELSNAEDGDGRPLYPILSPTNADGTTAAGLGAINVAGIKLDPTWSTSPGNDSFYADPQAVKVWNSGLSRLDRVKETAAGYYVDFWFYNATHVYDAKGVRKLTYTAA